MGVAEEMKGVAGLSVPRVLPARHGHVRARRQTIMTLPHLSENVT